MAFLIAQLKKTNRNKTENALKKLTNIMGFYTAYMSKF